MSSIFSLDSPLMKLLSRIADLMILNVLFVISCIPMITIGAACTALYDCTQRIHDNNGFGWKVYWKSFCRDFKKSTALWLILAVTGFLIGFGLVFYRKTEASIGNLGSIVCIVAAIVWLLASAWVFPIHAKYDNSPKQTIKNAILCGCMFLPQTIIAVLVNALPFAVWFWLPNVFVKMGVVWAMVWFAVGAALIHTRFEKPFARMNENDESADEQDMEESDEQEEENV